MKSNSLIRECLRTMMSEETGGYIAEARTAPKDENPIKTFVDFGCKLLMFGIQAHVWHLNCTTDAAHLALKDLYEACDDAGDKLLEAVLGMATGRIRRKNMDSFEFSDFNFGDDSIEEIEKIASDAKTLVNGDNPGLDNILSDFIEECNSVVYKLKRLA